MLQLIAKWDGLRDVWMREPQPKDRKRKKISLLEHWGVFSETWPTSGMMLDGRVYELPMSERLIREKECSLLPTPIAQDSEGGGSPGNLARVTPPTESNEPLLPTPTVGDKGGTEARSGEGFGAPLGEVARLLRTPCAAEAEGGPLHPEVAKACNQTLRLTGQVLAATGNLADSSGNTDNSWGDYAPAVSRWEQVLGRPAPAPTQPSRTGKPQLSPRFVEWMMGIPKGWVTDIDISRAIQLRALGNGVVPSQASAAIKEMISWTPHNT